MQKTLTFNTVLAYILVLTLTFFLIVPQAHANPLRPVPAASVSSATTSPTFMTAGLATTTTDAFDSFASGANAYPDRAALITQFTASSTSSVLGIRLEYSQDGIDWYSDSFTDLATTTGGIAIGQNNSFSWTFASSSQGAGPILANNNRALKVIFVTVPTRFIRAVYTLTGTNAAVWGSIIPQRQSN